MIDAIWHHSQSTEKCQATDVVVNRAVLEISDATFPSHFGFPHSNVKSQAVLIAIQTAALVLKMV